MERCPLIQSNISGKGLKLFLAMLVGMSLVAAGCSSEEVGSPPAPIGDRLEFRLAPSQVIAGEPFVPAVQVVVRRLDGVIDVTSTSDVTLSAHSASTADTLRGLTTVGAVGGVATFTGLTLSRVAADTRLFASAGGLTGAESAPFRVVAGAATQLVILDQPDSAIAGQAIPALRVQLRDASGNRLTSASSPVTVAISTGPGGATITGTSTADLVSGEARFTDVRLPRAGTGYTLSVTVVGNLTIRPAITRVFTTVPGAPADLAFSSEPAASIAGAPISPAVRVVVLDAFGNTVPGTTTAVTLELAVAPAGTQLGGTTTATPSAGVASFADLRVDRAATTVRLRATGSGLRPAISATFAVGAP